MQLKNNNQFDLESKAILNIKAVNPKSTRKTNFRHNLPVGDNKKELVIPLEKTKRRKAVIKHKITGITKKKMKKILWITPKGKDSYHRIQKTPLRRKMKITTSTHFQTMGFIL